ncbi:MAG: DUF3467 domain-containing protein [Trueperaceae bacterium]|nr:DUF3467 domain-containing protein [Trueperaceae bacterium]
MSPNQPTDTGDIHAPFIYANAVSIAVGVYDIQLDFAVEIDQKRTRTARVAMSPQHARSLQLLLERVLSDYEDNVGRIALPRDLESRLREKAPANENSNEDPS